MAAELFKDFHGSPIDLQHLDGPVLIRGALGRDGTSVAASRVERTDDSRLEIRGPVTSKDATAHRLVILGLQIDTSSAEFEGFPSSQREAFRDACLAACSGQRPSARSTPKR